MMFSLCCFLFYSHFYQPINSNLTNILFYYYDYQLFIDYGSYTCDDISAPGIAFRTLINADLSLWNKNNQTQKCVPVDQACELDKISESDSCQCLGYTGQAIVKEEFSNHSGFSLIYNVEEETENSSIAYVCDEEVFVDCHIDGVEGKSVDMKIHTPAACGHDVPCNQRQPNPATGNCMFPVDEAVCYILPNLTCGLTCPTSHEGDPIDGVCTHKPGDGGGGTTPKIKKKATPRWVSTLIIVAVVGGVVLVVGVVVCVAMFVRRRNKEYYRKMMK